MSLDFVPAKHLRHLLEKALRAQSAPKPTRDVMREKLGSNEISELNEALAFLERWQPGVIAQLENTWAFYAQRAVLVWLLPVLVEKTNPLVILKQRFPTRRKFDEWIDVPGDQVDGVQVYRVRAEEDALHAIVWVDKKIRFSKHGTVQVETRTEEVLLRIYYGGKGAPLVEAYAGEVDARKAIFALLDWALGMAVPRVTSKDQLKIMVPLRFNQKEIHQLAVLRGWGDPSDVQGKDVTGAAGRVKLWGHQKGFEPQPLDTSKPTIANQLAGDNEFRSYIIPFPHPDGYKEIAYATFHYGGHSRVTFTSRTSRLAMDWVIEEIRALLKV